MGSLSLQLLAIIPANLAYGSWKLFTVGLLSYNSSAEKSELSPDETAGYLWRRFVEPLEWLNR